MKRVLILLALGLALVTAQLTTTTTTTTLSPVTDNAVMIKQTIDDGIMTYNGILDGFNADDKKMLRDLNATLETERDKDELKAFMETQTDSVYVMMANMLMTMETFINEHLPRMTIRLANHGGYFSILSKANREDLTGDLESLKARLDAFLVHYNKVKNLFECKLAMKCYAEDLEKAEGQFYDMWNGVENLKIQCRTFDAHCIKKFMDYKTMFEQFEATKLPPLKDSLKNICDKKCYPNEDIRFNYEKSLLTLDISASGMVAAVQFAVKHAIVKRLNAVTKRMHIRKEKLNIYKLSIEDAVTKDHLSAALVNLKSLKFSAADDIYDFEEVFMMAISLEEKLDKKDFDQIKRQAMSMTYRLDGLKKQIDECIEKVENKHAFIAFKIEVYDNEATLLNNCEILKEKVRQVKDGRHRLCNELNPTAAGDTTLVAEFETIKASFTASDLEFKHLHSRLSKDFKDSADFETLKAAIAKFEADNLEKQKQAEKYKFFLHVYDKTHCDQP